MYEFVVWDNLDNVVHRGPWPEDDCVEWIESCRNTFPVGANVDKLYSVRRRPVGEWESYDY